MGVRINQRISKDTSVSVGIGWLMWPAGGLLLLLLALGQAMPENRAVAVLVLLAAVALVVYIVRKTAKMGPPTK